MKIKLIYFAGVIIAACLLGACHPGNILLKRHYTSGYYYAHAAKKKDTSPVAYGSNTTRGAVSVPQAVDKQLFMAGANEPAQPVARVDHGLATGKTSFNKSDKKVHRPPVYSLAPVVPNLRLAEMHPAFRPLASDRDGLSLLWIVILVILILWAVGYLGFGAGNLINLLLVVALILLILWLLRII